MVVCARCKKEMQCIKTGMTVRFRENGEHAYAGDMLECPECKATIAVTNANSYHDEGAKRATPSDIWMNADKGFKPEPTHAECNCPKCEKRREYDAYMACG